MIKEFIDGELDVISGNNNDYGANTKVANPTQDGTRPVNGDDAANNRGVNAPWWFRYRYYPAMPSRINEEVGGGGIDDLVDIYKEVVLKSTVVELKKLLEKAKINHPQDYEDIVRIIINEISSNEGLEEK